MASGPMMGPIVPVNPSKPKSMDTSWARGEVLIPTPLRIIKRLSRDPTPIRRFTVRDRRKANLSHKYQIVEKVALRAQPKYYGFPRFLDGHSTPPPSPHPLLNQSTPSRPTTAVSCNTFISLDHQPADRDLSRTPLSPSLKPDPQKTSLQAQQQIRRCCICSQILGCARDTYSFPATSPSAILAVTKLPYFPNHVSLLDTERQLIFCYSCFVHIHNLHLCWSCGLTVTRPEERVSCGWAWWHWGCLACMLCRAPMTPPEWSENAGGVRLGESPACRVCRREIGETMRVNGKDVETAGPPRDEMRRSSYEEEQSVHYAPDPHLETDGAIESSGGGDRRDERVLGWLARQHVLTHKGTSDKYLYDGACESRQVDFRKMYPPLPRWMEMLPGNVNKKRQQT